MSCKQYMIVWDDERVLKNLCNLLIKNAKTKTLQIFTHNYVFMT